MVHLILGERGSGKSKKIIEMANNQVENCTGDIVFIDDDKRPIHELHRNIRFVTTSDYRITSSTIFYGFLCGIMSQNYDIQFIFIDGVSNIIEQENLGDMKDLFLNLKEIAEKWNIEFYISANASEEIPEFLKEFICVK
ncbi:MAG: hypothetical protein FWC47_11060 [Oscillospiraceae bacterium]|nr:hypothetical protein [Oscillospiraceae bacterium]